MSKQRDEIIVNPPDGKGHYHISATVVGSQLWIDAFSDHSDDPCLVWKDGKWQQRNPWEVDEDCSFKLEDKDEG